MNLWGKVCAGGVLPPRCDRAWFFATFCGVGAAEFRERGHAALSAGNCDIAEHLNGAVKPYDVVAFMTVALPDEVAAGA